MKQNFRYDQWEDALLKAVLLDEIEAEIAEDQRQLSDDERAAIEQQGRRMAPAMERWIEGKVKRMNRSWNNTLRNALKTTVAAALTLCLGVGGVCVASPEIRENLFVLVESAIGGRTQLYVNHTGTTQDSADLITVEPDDPRLRYVHPDWCLHYYPLEIPSAYNDVTVQGMNANWSQVMWKVQDEWEDEPRLVESMFYYLDDEAREKILEYDYQEIIFENPDNDEMVIRFTEDGRWMNHVNYDKKAVWKQVDGKDVAVIEENGMTTYVWREDDHLLTLASSVGGWYMDAIFSSVERIR